MEWNGMECPRTKTNNMKRNHTFSKIEEQGIEQFDFYLLNFLLPCFSPFFVALLLTSTIHRSGSNAYCRRSLSVLISSNRFLNQINSPATMSVWVSERLRVCCLLWFWSFEAIIGSFRAQMVSSSSLIKMLLHQVLPLHILDDSNEYNFSKERKKKIFLSTTKNGRQC